jgi:hypothetical protein
MAMKIELTIWQRFALLQALGSLRGDLKTMRLGAKVMDKVELSKAEKRAAGVRSQGSSVTWSGPAAKEVDLPDAELDLVRSVVQEYNGWSMNNVDELFELVEKLEESNADKA